MSEDKDVKKAVSLEDALLSQRTISEKFEDLCKTPMASSAEEAQHWMANHKEFLEAKAKNVVTMPRELENDVDTMFVQSRDIYYDFIESWYDFGMGRYQKNLIYQKQKSLEINGDEAQERYEAIKKIDFQKAQKNKKIQDFFDIFESIIDAINNHKNWFDLYKATNIRGDGLVWSIASLDLFVWQMPSADFRDKNNYCELAKIMTIFFFFEKLYKNEFQLSNQINPFDKLMNLDKIVSYYYFSKNLGLAK
jgi:hypothetical protein